VHDSHFSFYKNGFDFEKEEIAQFEANPCFGAVFQDLSSALIEEKEEYFNKLINQIKFCAYAKFGNSKSSKNEGESDGVIPANDNPKNMRISKVNYIIDAPIQLRIIDVLWTLLFGWALSSNPHILEKTYAYRFSYQLFSNTSSSFWKSVDFNSPNLFAPYFRFYKEWRMEAVNQSKERHSKHGASTIFSLDLTRYFYNTDINLNKIVSDLPFDPSIREQLDKYTFLTNLIQKIYNRFSALIKPYHSDVKRNVIIPIGLTSSGVIANVYLYKFDHSFETEKSILFYGRYVDDMLIVVDSLATRANRLKAISSMQEKLPHFFEFHETPGTDPFVSLNGFPNLVIGRSKIHVIRIQIDHSAALLDSLNDDLASGSEPHLVSNPDLSLSNLVRFAFENERKNSHLKIRDTEDVQADSGRLWYFCKNYTELFSRLNLVGDNLDAKAITLKTIEDACDPQTILLLSPRWWKLCQFFACLNKRASMLPWFDRKALQAIQKMRFTSTKKGTLPDPSVPKDKVKKRELLVNMRSTLTRDFNVCMATGESLRAPLFRDSKRAILAHQIRGANLIDCSFVGFPLLNYSFDDSLTGVDLWSFSPSFLAAGDLKINFDPRKIRLSPRFVHFEEYTVSKILRGLVDLRQGSYLVNVYKDYDGLFLSNPFTKRDSLFEINLSSIDGSLTHALVSVLPRVRSSDDKCFVSLANLDLSAYKMIAPKFHTLNLNQATINNKRSIFSALNDLLKQKEKDKKKRPWFLSMPEFALPHEWLIDLAEFSRRNQVAVISGLTFAKTSSCTIRNYIATILPTTDSFGYKYALVFLREKNNYSPEEYYLVSQQTPKLTISDSKVSLYYLFTWNNIVFSVFDCYELTDMGARASFFVYKPIPELLFATEFNKDVPYFNSLIISTARELYCYVVQNNSSSVGDSQIVLPRHKNPKASSIGGGCFPGVHTALIDLGLVKQYLFAEKYDGSFPEYCDRYRSRILTKQDIKKYKQFDELARTGAKRNKK